MGRVVIRCETSPGRGLGHVVRGLALADEMRGRGWLPLVALDANEVAASKATGSGVVALTRQAAEPEEAFVSRAAEGCDVVVLDSPFPYSAAFVSSLRDAHRVVMLDHAPPGAFAADLTLFPSGATPAQVIDDPRWADAPRPPVHGPQYVILNPAVLPLARERGAHAVTHGPLVILAGGEDPADVLGRLAPPLARDGIGREVIVLIGEAAPPSVRARLRADLKGSRARTEPFDVRWLLQAGMAVTAFGISVYELMYLGIPSLVVGHSEASAEHSRIVAERYGATLHLGEAARLTSTAIVTAVRLLSGDDARRRDLAERASATIDGRGAERVADEIDALHTSLPVLMGKR